MPHLRSRPPTCRLAKHIGEQLHSARRCRDMTLRRLADCSQLSISHLSEIECGYKVPGARTLIALCRALEFPPNYFLSEPINWRE